MAPTTSRTITSTAVAGKRRQQRASAQSAKKAHAERSALFRLSPLALRSQLEVDWRLEALDEVEEPSEEAADDELDEADLDETDVDEPVEVEAREYEFSELYLTLLRPTADYDSPLLDLANLYALRVVLDPSGRATCHFEPPAWWGDVPRRGNAAARVLQNLQQFLSRVAGWLTESKQRFLSEPCAANYVMGEGNDHAQPIVTQEGFVTRVAEASGTGFKKRAGHRSRDNAREQMTPEDFSRAKGHMWILWERFCMPLDVLFSDEYRKAWVIHFCLAQFPRSDQWPSELAKFSREDLGRIAQIAAMHCAPEELLQKCCATTALNADAVFRSLRQQLN